MLASESHLTNTSVCHQKSVTVQYIHVHASGIVAVSVSYLCLSIVSRPFISWVTYYMCRYLKFIVLNFSRKCWPHLNFCMPYELFIKCYSKLYCMFRVIFKINQLIINNPLNYHLFFARDINAATCKAFANSTIQIFHTWFAGENQF